MTTTMIRPAVEADLPAIQHVAQLTWRATYTGLIPDSDIEHFMESAYSRPRLATRLRQFGDGFLVAVLDALVVGYAMAGTSRDGDPELFALYVLPEFQGTGAGSCLWQAARAVLAARGDTRMCLWVLAANTRARRFYERQGAIMTEEREFQIGATPIRQARYCVATAD